MAKKKFTKKGIVNYYQSSQWLYRLFCYNPQSLGMHFGFWNKNTKNRQEAISNENEEIIKVAGIKRGMKVLDAGCGIGGTSLQIAKKKGAEVWGITIVPQHVILANKYAKKRRVSKLVNFSVQDYIKTNFPSNFFDVVVGIESVCHASPKSSFLKEAYRILKPGGKIVIADGYLGRQPRNRKEKEIITKFKQSFALTEFILGKSMLRQMRETGFVHVISRNMNDQVEPSVICFSNLAKRMKLPCLISKYIPIPYIQEVYRNYVALKMTDEGWKTGLAAYFIHSGQKP